MSIRARRRVVGLIGFVVVLGAAAWLLRARPTAPLDSYAACARAGYPISESYPPTCSDGQHVFVGPRAAATTTPAAATNQPFDILVDGDSHGNYPQRQEVIATAAQWQQYWAAVHASLATLPPLLPVDFATASVIVLSEGSRPTSGYSLKVTGITTSAAGTVVSVNESIPTITCAVTMLATNPYYIVRTTKLTLPISFRITTEHRQCRP